MVLISILFLNILWGSALSGIHNSSMVLKRFLLSHSIAHIISCIILQMEEVYFHLYLPQYIFTYIYHVYHAYHVKNKGHPKTYLHISCCFSCFSRTCYEFSLFYNGFTYLHINISKTGV